MAGRALALHQMAGLLDYATLGSFVRGIDAMLDSNPELRWVLIAGHTLERIDAAAAEGLAEVIGRIRASGRQVCASGLREEVLAELQRTGIEAAIGVQCVFATQERAIRAIHAEAHRRSDEAVCPLLEAVRADRP
jgi:MFS superfamily sulfate permease-like transporter